MRTVTLALILGFVLISPLAVATPPPLDDPVSNGDFESPFIPAAVTDVARGSPVDVCTGIGHQALYGSDTWQADAEDAAMALAGGDTDGAQDNATEAYERWQGDPAGEATFFAGYGHCVSSGSDGEDLAWLHPFATAEKPAGWSLDAGNPGVTFGYDLPGDDDPFNRAAMFIAGSSHNMWQSFASTHQAYSGNHESFGFDILNGGDNIPSSASVKISFSTTPLESQNPWLVAFVECDLTYKRAQLVAGLQADGSVLVDPTDGVFASRAVDCDDAAARWATADTDARRDILGQLRMVQLSFWNWNSAYAPGENVVIDNVAMSGTTLFVEEAPNANPGP